MQSIKHIFGLECLKKQTIFVNSIKINLYLRQMLHYQSIKHWAEDDRPREKLLLKGKTALSDAELLAILLGSGSRSKSALELAQDLLRNSDNDLAKFSKVSVHELKNTKGIGDAKAVTIIAALELGRRRKETLKTKKNKITSSQTVYDYMRPYFMDLLHEEFHILLLNRANEVIASQRISSGGLSGTVADGKVIFKTALDFGSHGIILLHNHPSGQLTPSDQDNRLTKKLVDFGRCIDLLVLDHLIFTDNGYFSYADNGLL